MEDCIFCKIAEGDIPHNKVAESENFVAFLDIAPVNKGHTLIVPKKHSTNFLDTPEYLGNEFFEFAQRVGQAIVSGVKADGFNLGMNNGPAAGQVVFHTHFHLIPRFKDDGLSLWPSGKASQEEQEAILKSIQQALQ